MVSTVITGIKQQISENLYYVLFLLLLLAFVAVNFYDTLDYRRLETILLPRWVLATTAILIVIELCRSVIPPVWRKIEFLPFEVHKQEPEDTENSSGAFSLEIDKPGLVIGEVILVSAFLGLVYFVGFFTTTTVYTFGYILLKGDRDFESKDLIVAAVWTGTFVFFLYILFIFLLGSRLILQFGFLP